MSEERSSSAEREDRHLELLNIADTTRGFIIQATSPHNLLMQLAAQPVFHPTDTQWQLIREAAELNNELVEVATVQSPRGLAILKRTEVGNYKFPGEK